MAIFSYMVGNFQEVFMDNFDNLKLVLCRCEKTNLVLTWEKCHFMVHEGIVLGHKISQQGISMDKAKIEVIKKCRLLPLLKAMRDFIEDLLRISRRYPNPFYALLEHNRPFNFDEPCLRAFEELKQLVTTPIIIPSEWTLPFELV
ncbi:reverse transcriptase [Gossypium australe]|uniref:Reverse transcriptase n=1 Tax=Gossypium australe TaxID=47621 RepID=A0A5B6UZ10_9ROSI|nr:reverse transcriptase [Gossypium australe]